MNSDVDSLKPYPLITQEAWSFQDKSKVLKLDWNEGVSPPSPFVKDQILKFLNSNEPLNWYPKLNNENILLKISEYCNTSIKNVQYFPSSDNLQEIIARTFINPGDEIVMISPTYDNFRSTFQAAGASINRFYLDGEKFYFDIETFFNDYFNKDIKIVYLCNPNNPTGTEFSKEVILSLLKEFNSTLFVIDEAYYEFSNNTVADIVENHENLVISRTLSKGFCLAGFRLGYMVANKTLISAVNKIRNPKNISTISQIACLAALSDINYMKNYVEEISISKKYFIEELKDMGFDVLHGGGNYVSIKIAPNYVKNLVEYLKANLVYVRDYSHVEKMEGYIRITIGKKLDMIRVVDILKNYSKI